MYRTTDPYAEVATAVNEERARMRFVGQRTADLHADMRRPFTARVEPADWCFAIEGLPVSLARDFGAWMEMQGDETIGRAMFDAQYRAECVGRYIEARVRYEADKRDWCAEAEEERAWERGGMV